MAENQQSQKSGSLLGWVAGIFLVILGLANVSGHLGAAIFFFIAACFVLPPTLKGIETKITISKSHGGKMVAGILLVVICSIVALSIGVSDSPSLSSSQNQNSSAPASEPAPIVVTATKLMADYNANEVAADAQYKGRIVDVSGTINSIGKDILDAPYVALSTNEYYSVVQCMFSKSDQAQLASLSKDTRITLRGRVSGKLGNIIVRDCSIVR